MAVFLKLTRQFLLAGKPLGEQPPVLIPIDIIGQKVKPIIHHGNQLWFVPLRYVHRHIR